MKKRLYIGLIVFAVLLLAFGRLIVRPPRVLRKRRGLPRPSSSAGSSTPFYLSEVS
jgi:hypothetical protein